MEAVTKHKSLSCLMECKAQRGTKHGLPLHFRHIKRPTPHPHSLNTKIAERKTTSPRTGLTISQPGLNTQGASTNSTCDNRCARCGQSVHGGYRVVVLLGSQELHEPTPGCMHCLSSRGQLLWHGAPGEAAHRRVHQHLARGIAILTAACSPYALWHWHGALQASAHDRHWTAPQPACSSCGLALG